MKKLVIWLFVIAAVATAASLTVARFVPASSALKRFVRPGPLSPGHAYLANQCESCHVTNVGVTAAKCTVCHANDERLLGRQPTSFTPASGSVQHVTWNIRVRTPGLSRWTTWNSPR